MDDGREQIQVRAFGHQMAVEKSDPYVVAKRSRLQSARDLHVNKWQRKKTASPTQVHSFREIKETFFSELGTLLGRSFSQLYHSMSEDELWLLFLIFTDKSGSVQRKFHHLSKPSAIKRRSSVDLTLRRQLRTT
jgi:hypothetical protein